MRLILYKTDSQQIKIFLVVELGSTVYVRLRFGMLLDRNYSYAWIRKVTVSGDGVAVDVLPYLL